MILYAVRIESVENGLPMSRKLKKTGKPPALYARVREILEAARTGGSDIHHAVRAELEAIPHALRALSASKISDAPRRKSEKGHAVRGQSTLPEQASSRVRSELEILHAPRGESWQPGQLHPHLSGTHYRTLLRVGKPEARSFYKIGVVHSSNEWSCP